MVLILDQTGGDKPKLCALDDDTNGIRYLKTAGEIMNTLIEEEGKGNITLPTRFGDGVVSPSLVESWATFGIPLVLLLGIRLGEVATCRKMPLSPRSKESSD